MAAFYQLEPEVLGELGGNTKLELRTDTFPLVLRLHCIFTAWLGDDLVTCYPCYLVTPHLSTQLERAGLTGFSLRDAEITPDMYTARDHACDLPLFAWLDVIGVPGKDDLGLLPDSSLVVSDAALAPMCRAKSRSTSRPRLGEGYWADNNRHHALGRLTRLASIPPARLSSRSVSRCREPRWPEC